MTRIMCFEDLRDEPLRTLSVFYGWRYEGAETCSLQAQCSICCVGKVY